MPSRAQLTFASIFQTNCIVFKAMVIGDTPDTIPFFFLIVRIPFQAMACGFAVTAVVINKAFPTIQKRL